MRLPEANAVNTLVSVLAGIRPYSQNPLSHVDLEEVLAAVEVLTVASWVELRTGWSPADARLAVEADLRRQRYGVDPETGLYPEEMPAEPLVTVEIHDAKSSPEVRMRLLKGATTEQLLASRDELQAAITAAPQPADVPHLATALRQVQTELGQRYLLARRPRRVPLTWSPAERAQFVTAVRSPGDLVEDEDGAPLPDEQQPPDAQAATGAQQTVVPDDESHLAMKREGLL